MTANSNRAKAAKNLLVAAVNAAIEQRLITLECKSFDTADFKFSLAGHPVFARVHDAGFDEVSICATIRPTEMGRRFISWSICYEWRKFGEATASGWLERRSGKYLQSAFGFHGTREMKETLAGLVVEPRGFSTKPVRGGYDNQEFLAVFGRRP